MLILSAVLGIILFCLVPSQLAAEEGVLADDVSATLAAYDAACQILRSYDVTLDWKVQRIGAPQGEQSWIIRSRQWYSEGRYRADKLVDGNRNFQPRQETWNWDKHQEIVIDTNNQAVISEYPRSGERCCGIQWQILFREFFPGVSYYKLMSARDTQMTRREDGTIELFAPPPKNPDQDAGNMGFRLVLDPGLGLLPTRIEQLVKHEGKLKLWTSFDNELYEVSAGCWVPVRSKKTLFDIEVAGEAKVLNASEIGIEVPNSKFNAPIDDAVFDVSIPDGFTVTNKIINTVWTSGDADSEKHMEDILSKGHTALDQYGQGESMPSVFRLWRPLIILINVVVAIFIGSFFALRAGRR